MEVMRDEITHSISDGGHSRVLERGFASTPCSELLRSEGSIVSQEIGGRISRLEEVGIGDVHMVFGRLSA
jgi:hypothetical protein